jgi:hypothetical protein
MKRMLRRYYAAYDLMRSSFNARFVTGKRLYPPVRPVFAEGISCAVTRKNR